MEPTEAGDLSEGFLIIIKSLAPELRCDVELAMWDRWMQILVIIRIKNKSIIFFISTQSNKKQ